MSTLSGKLSKLLPIEIWQHIYSYDPTWHDAYKAVMHELTVINELRHIFRTKLDLVLFSPTYRHWLSNNYAKKDFLCLTKVLDMRVSRRVTKRRLLAALCAYHMSLTDGLPEMFMDHAWLFL